MLFFPRGLLGCAAGFGCRMRLVGRGSEVVGHRGGQAKRFSVGFVLVNILNVSRSQVTRVFWLVFGSDNYFVGTFVCVRCEPGDVFEEGEGYLVVKGLRVSRFCVRILIGVQGS